MNMKGWPFEPVAEDIHTEGIGNGAGRPNPG